MPINDIRNSAMAPRNGVNSCRRRSASHSPSAISAVTIGTGESKAIFGQLNQRRAMSGWASGVQMLTPAMAKEDRDQANRCGAARPILQLTFGFENEPSSAKEHIAESQRHSGGERKRREPIEGSAGKLPAIDLEALDECAEHNALGKRRHQRTATRCAVPDPPQRCMLETELECDAAENERQQHHQDREIDRGNDDREGERKSRE